MAPTDDTAQGYKAKMDDLASYTPQQLADLRDEIAAAFEDADSRNDVEGMSAAADAKDAVEKQAEQLGVDLDKLPESEGDKPADAAAAEDNKPAAAPAPAAPTEEAAVDAPTVPADRQPLPVAAASVTIVAGADVPGVSAGTPYVDRRQFTQAHIDKIDALRNAVGYGEKVITASVKAPPVDDSRMLTGDPSDFEKIAEVVGRDAQHVKALVASGGYCAPLEPRYEVFGIGSTARPVRGALPGFRSSRGGIRFITPPKLSGVTGSTGVWTAATDASPGGATKNKLIVACGAEQTVSISAITMEMQFGNFIARAYPEMVERNVELGLIQQARLAEQTLLTAIGTASTAVTSASVLGTARDLLVTVARAASAYRTRHRMDPDTPLRAIIPAWVRDAMREDVAWSLSPTTDESLAESDGSIEGYLSARNVNVAWHLDDSAFTGAQAAGAVADFPSTIVWNLFAEGSFLFLDGGTLDIGIVRDSTLVGTNDYIQFTENFEAVAFVGVEALKVTSTTKVLGKTSAAVTTS